MELIIPSHDRAGSVITHETVAGSRICVAESQYKAYKECYPDNDIIVHPDSVKGISPKRNWMLQNFPNHFQLDDDIKSIDRVYLGPGQKKDKIGPEDARGLILDIYHSLKDTDFKMFGFTKSARPLHYNPSKPIYNTGFIMQAMGFIEGGNLHFPEIDNLIGEDEFICAYNAFINRKIWIDKRFYFNTDKSNYNVGGCGHFRDHVSHIESFTFLKKNFGNAIFGDYSKAGMEMGQIMWRMRIPY